MRNGEVGWTPVVRRNKMSEESDSSGNLNVMIDLNKGRSLVWYKMVKGIPRIYILDICKLRDGWQ